MGAGCGKDGVLRIGLGHGKSPSQRYAKSPATPEGSATPAPTISEWLNLLELTGQIILIPPYFENFGKRIVKSPKLYIGDSGLACHLLGIRSTAELIRSPFFGAIFEGFVASEILKHQVNGGGRKEIYHFRDRQGLEVDFLVPSEGALWIIECKASRTVNPTMARPLISLRRSIGSNATRAVVVHRSSATEHSTRAIAPGAEAMDVRELVRVLAGSNWRERPVRQPP